MRLPALLTSDIHLTASAKDAYRFGLFPWLREQCKVHAVKTLCILGDITDAKDCHSAELVNRIVAEIAACARCVEDVYILTGNHDYLHAGHPFFAFLSRLPRVRFINTLFEPPAEDCTSLFLPHTHTPARDWADLSLDHFQYVFMHQTVSGSIASNGMRMEGEQMPDLSAAGKVYSGDIHVPQIVGAVEYVGSPYHVHFGDKFTPRCVLLPRRGLATDLHMPCLSRFVLAVESLAELKAEVRGLREGDQVKLRMRLDASELHAWANIRREAVQILRDGAVEVHGVELVAGVQRRLLRRRSAPRINPESAVVEYVRREGWSADALDVGLEVMK